MKDALQTKLNLTLAVAVAFAAGLGVSAGLDLTPPTMASDTEPVFSGEGPELQIGAPDDLLERIDGLDFRTGFSSIVEEVQGATVTIHVEKRVAARGQPPRLFPSPFEEFFEPRRERQEEPPLAPGTGSGFVVSQDGFIVTNNHVVEDAETIRVTLADRREFSDARVVGRDPQTDVALLKVDAEGLPYVALGDSDAVRVGEWVVAVGSPGFGQNNILPFTVTAGIVSAKGRSLDILNRRLQERGLQPLAIEDFIQTDAVINRGNSGGPLVNTRGEVVGMNTAIMTQTGTFEGYGFAVPIKLVRHVIDDLMEYGEVRRAVLGILIQEVSAADARYYGLDAVAGVKVDDFSRVAGEHSPAREAGVQDGDIIIEVDGQPVESVADLQSRIRGYSPGDVVTLTLVRRPTGEREQVDVRLAAADTPQRRAEAERERAHERDPLGIEARELDPEIRQRLGLSDEVTGVLVSDADRRGALVRAAGQLPRFTIIRDIDGREIRDLSAYRSFVDDLEPGDIVNVRLYIPIDEGEGQNRFVTVEIPETE